jgi:hypothetical protein
LSQELRLAFRRAYHREYNALASEHIRDVAFDGQRHNNKMERMSGEIRDREKVARNFKKPDTPILVGMRIFHNYVRSHMALDGQTPAEKAGIVIKGENKWLTLIQNSAAHG